MSPPRLATRELVVDTVQLLWKCPIADEAYVSERGWEKANLERCPFHPDGGCGVERLGTYRRVEPSGVQVARWWCPKEGASISLLPLFLAARWRGTLKTIEDVVAEVEEVGVAAAIGTLYPAEAEKALGLEGARRSIQRRMKAVRAALLALLTLLPERLLGAKPTIASFRERLGTDRVLASVRELAERHLGALPVPLGFGARASG